MTSLKISLSLRVNRVTARFCGRILALASIATLSSISSVGAQVVETHTFDPIYPPVAQDAPDPYLSPAMVPSPAVPPSSSGSAVKKSVTNVLKNFGAFGGLTVPPLFPNALPRRVIGPAPYDPVFPSTEFLGPTIGSPDTDGAYPLERALYKACPLLRRQRIKIYGWGNPGCGWSTSHHSNIPNSYFITPNSLQLDQLILRIERTPDTAQNEHNDWGFRYTSLYGIDYRWTTAQGWGPASQELLKHNALYGYDPVELYGQFYMPKVAKGMLVKVGRYISPPDIEAQLAPDNYLWTHSQMFTFDAYTHTGINAAIKLNKQWTVQAGIHAGSDMAPWAAGAIPTGELYLKYDAKNNKDSFYGGIDAINSGRFRLGKRTIQAQNDVNNVNTAFANLGSPLQIANPKIAAHDNLQQFNFTWSHAFSRRVHTATEAYLLYSIDALQGGTVVNGPSRSFNANVGPGRLLPHTSMAWGVVNYTNIKVTDHDFISIRPIDFLGDPRGWRTGFPATLASWTIGWTHRFSDTLSIRPEIRYDRSLSRYHGAVVRPYDNGTKIYQLTMGFDLIQRF